MDALGIVCLAVNLVTLAYCGWHSIGSKGSVSDA